MDAPTTDPAVVAGCDALDGTGGVAIERRDVIDVRGPDAGRFLQGQLSQDVVAMSGRSAWSFLLAPTGKVVAWLCVHRLDPDHYLLEVDEGWGPVVVERLRRFLLRTDAVIGEPVAWSLARRRWGRDVVRLGMLETEHPSPPVIGPGESGVDVLLAPGEEPPSDDLPVVPLASMERHRLAHGIPRMGAELDEETIPAEAGAWVIDASVSFTKGCYTGQELVARIDSRGGQVPRPVRVLRLDGPGAAVGDVVSSGDDATVRGALTSVVPRLSDDRPALALATLARSVAIGDVVTVTTAGGVVEAAVVEPASVR